MDHIGIDLHKRESQICILAEGGELIERRIRTDPHRFAEVLGERAPACILLEASTESEWVARCLEALGHPVVVADPNFASLSRETDLAFPLVQIDANMVHGWPPSPCASERVISLWGTLCHHVESGVSRFISSTLSPERQVAALQLNRNMENENRCAKAKSLS